MSHVSIVIKIKKNHTGIKNIEHKQKQGNDSKHHECNLPDHNSQGLGNNANTRMSQRYSNVKTIGNRTVHYKSTMASQSLDDGAAADAGAANSAAAAAVAALMALMAAYAAVKSGASEADAVG